MFHMHGDSSLFPLHSSHPVISLPPLGEGWGGAFPLPFSFFPPSPRGGPGWGFHTFMYFLHQRRVSSSSFIDGPA